MMILVCIIPTSIAYADATGYKQIMWSNITPVVFCKKFKLPPSLNEVSPT